MDVVEVGAQATQQGQQDEGEEQRYQGRSHRGVRHDLQGQHIPMLREREGDCSNSFKLSFNHDQRWSDEHKTPQIKRFHSSQQHKLMETEAREEGGGWREERVVRRILAECM